MASGGAHRGHTHRHNDSDAGFGVPRASEDGRVLETIGSADWTAYAPRPHWAPAFPSSAETAFLLPVSAETLYFVSRGSHHYGRVEVAQSESTETATAAATVTEEAERNEVRVDVRVAYHDPRALTRATICRLRKSGNRHGVGVYTPNPSCAHPRDQLYFEVLFTFPGAPSPHTPLRIRGFTTHAHQFVHEIGDVWKALVFDNIELDTTNAAIRAKSITLARGTLTTSNADIVGHFNTSAALFLRTANGRIQATASLFHAPGADPTQLDMRTSNGAITSAISLAAPAARTRPAFAVTARTSNGALALRYDDGPPGARVLSDARTSNGAVGVTMHPAFEGTFEVGTSNAMPTVRDTGAVDPAGRGRRRVVEQTVGRGQVRGRAYWPGGGVEGSSKVYTSNARACLDV